MRKERLVNSAETLKSLFNMTEKHAINGNVITIDPLGCITISGLVPHVPSQFIVVITPFPGMMVISRHTSKQTLLVVHAIAIPLPSDNIYS